MTDSTVPVQVAVSRVMRDMPAVGKNGKNTHSNYKYRSIDDLLGAFSKALAAHGVIIIPNGTSHETRTIGKSQYVTVRMEYTVIGPAGDTLTASYYGEGQDVGDKATAKAQTAAYKYLMITMFNIPVEDIVDGDASTPNRAEDQREAEEWQRKADAAWEEAMRRVQMAATRAGMNAQELDQWCAEQFGGVPRDANVQQLAMVEERLQQGAGACTHRRGFVWGDDGKGHSGSVCRDCGAYEDD